MSDKSNLFMMKSSQSHSCRASKASLACNPVPTSRNRCLGSTSRNQQAEALRRLAPGSSEAPGFGASELKALIGRRKAMRSPTRRSAHIRSWPHSRQTPQASRDRCCHSATPKAFKRASETDPIASERRWAASHAFGPRRGGPKRFPSSCPKPRAPNSK